MENGFTVFMNLGYARYVYLKEQGLSVESDESEEDEYRAAAVMLLEYRADLNSRRDDGQTVLMNACFAGLLPITRFVLENSADVNVGDNGGRTALMDASILGFKETIKLLLSHRANAIAKDIHNSNAIDYALGEGHV